MSPAERHARNLERDPRLRAQAERTAAGTHPADPRSEPALPSLARLAVNAVHSGITVARAKAAHLSATILASPAVLEARLRVCRWAEGLAPDQTSDGHCDRYRPSDDRCADGGCGCHLERTHGGIPGRAAYAALDCPLGRWPAIPRESP